MISPWRRRHYRLCLEKLAEQLRIHNIVPDDLFANQDVLDHISYVPYTLLLPLPRTRPILHNYEHRFAEFIMLYANGSRAFPSIKIAEWLAESDDCVLIGRAPDPDYETKLHNYEDDLCRYHIAQRKHKEDIERIKQSQDYKDHEERERQKVCPTCGGWCATNILMGHSGVGDCSRPCTTCNATGFIVTPEPYPLPQPPVAPKTPSEQLRVYVLISDSPHTKAPYN